MQHTLFKILSNYIIVALVIGIISPVYAQTRMDSTNFRIDYGNINVTSGKKSSGNYNVTDTVGQFAPGRYTSNGYLVRAGFQYIYSIIPFYFSVSKTSIPFGTVAPQTPGTDTALLTVSNGSAGYQVTAIEDDQLQKEGGATILDTTCDAAACDETTAAPWTSNSIYGFGYNMSGNDIPATFTDSTYYRPFPSEGDTENPAIVMSSSSVGTDRQATITFKVNISTTQEAGNYQNIIRFTATPLY